MDFGQIQYQSSLINMISFRTIARILRKLELPRPFSKKSKSYKITNPASFAMKTVTIKEL